MTRAAVAAVGGLLEHEPEGGAVAQLRRDPQTERLALGRAQQQACAIRGVEGVPIPESRARLDACYEGGAWR